MSGFPVVHIDFVSNAPEASASFYQKLLGWKIDNDPNFEGYPMFNPESGPAGGFMRAEDNNSPGDIILYVHAPDLAGTLALAEQQGGKVLVPETEIPGVGWFAVIGEPSGTRLGLFKGLSD